MTCDIRRPERFCSPPIAVIFDTDNTLYSYSEPNTRAMEAVSIKASKLLGIRRHEFDAAFHQARLDVKLRLGSTASSHSRLLYFQRAIELLGMRTQLLMTLDLEQTYWRIFLSQASLFEEVTEFLIDLRARGILTAVITDLTSQIQFRKLTYFNLDNCFDYIVTSEEVGLDKPNKEPFKLLLQKLGVNPIDVWMIGDHPDNDIAGAKQFSMVTLQKCHSGVVVRRGDEGPDLVFQTFTDLRKLFNNIYTDKSSLSN